MNVHYFIGACLLAIVMLVPLGAPISAVAGGITLATLIKLVNVWSAKSKRGKKQDSGHNSID